MNKNKGFSLVELIVVVAIMAVLVGILAPAYLSYVEKTRRGADENTAEEVRHAVEVAAAEIKVYDEVIGNGSGVSYSWTAGTTVIKNGTNVGTNMAEALNDVYGDKPFEAKSKKYKGATYTVTIAISGTNSAALQVTGNWSGTH